MINERKLPLSLRLIRKLSLPKKLGILERLYGRKLSQFGVCWVECSNGVMWKLDLEDSCHRWIVYGKYEGGYGIDLAASILKNGGVYVDSGANIGQWLLYIGHIEGLRTLAFEPVKSQRAWLTECIKRQSQWGVEIIEHGLGAEDAELDIQVNGARSTIHMDWYTDQNFKREKISLRKLEAVLETHNIDIVDFWKLDTEGAEYQALLGAKKYLQEHKIRHIYFECHPSNYREILELFQLCGYGVYYFKDGKLLIKTDDTLLETQDLVAMPK